MALLGAIGLWLAFGTGCAGYTIEHDGKGIGYDVYKPEPYLLFVSGKNGHKTSIIWLPDYGNRYRISTWNFLAKADFEFEIPNGWMLTRIVDQSDTAGLADALVKAMEEARKSDVIPLAEEPFQLFRFVYGSDGRVAGLAKMPVDLLASQHQPPVIPN